MLTDEIIVLLIVVDEGMAESGEIGFVASCSTPFRNLAHNLVVTGINRMNIDS
jgi:hypothetical protein